MSASKTEVQESSGDAEHGSASMFCRDCRGPLHGKKVSRCPVCGRPYNPTNPRTYLTSPMAGRFSWHGVISWGVFLLAQVYGTLAFVLWKVTAATLTGYGVIVAVGVIIAIVGTRKPPWLNQVICFIALMAYALALAGLVMSQVQ